MGPVLEPGEPTAEESPLAVGEFIGDTELQLDDLLEGAEGRVAGVKVIQNLARGVVLLAISEQAGLAQQGPGLAFGAGLPGDQELQGRQRGPLFAGGRLPVGLPEHGLDHRAAAWVRLVAGGGAMRVILRGAGDQQTREQEEFRAKVHASEGGLRPR